MDKKKTDKNVIKTKSVHLDIELPYEIYHELETHAQSHGAAPNDDLMEILEKGLHDSGWDHPEKPAIDHHELTEKDAVLKRPEDFANVMTLMDWCKLGSIFGIFFLAFLLVIIGVGL